MSVMSVKGVKVGYGLSCNVIWAAVSAFAILAMPFLLEQERSGILEQQKEQERQVQIQPNNVQGFYAPQKLPLCLSILPELISPLPVKPGGL